MTTRPPSAIVVSLAGMLSLAAAMGIGRFAFTPVLPLMIRDGHLQVAAGGWLAAANYLGYLVGAVAAARVAASASRLTWLSLAGIAITTGAMTLHAATSWLALRFVAGACSAGVFVATSVWCLGALDRMQRQDLGPAVYAGVGVGIATAGGYCLWAGIRGWPSDLVWLHLGLLAAGLSMPVVLVVRRLADFPMGAVGSRPEPGPPPRGTAGLVGCYGIMGLGYILPATFLPVMAREVNANPSVFGSAWPLFGVTAAASTLVAGPAMRSTSRLHVWAVCQLLMAIGALLPALVASAMTILLSALLVGSTFMVVTLAGVQEIRARMPGDAAAWVGYLTASFAFGQIAGPAAAALLLAQPALAPTAMGRCLEAAAALLAFSAAWLWCQADSSPSHRS